MPSSIKTKKCSSYVENKRGKNDSSPLREYYRDSLQALMNDYYKKLADLEKEKTQPVAWITTMVPIEIVNAAGVFPFYPENYSALCAARGKAKALIQVSESKGVPRDLCGYATCNIGSVLSGEWAFGEGGVPKPDLLIATRLTCNIHLNWWTYLARYYDAPLFIVDAPYKTSVRYEERDIVYFVKQINKLIRFIEEKTSLKADEEALRSVMDLSDQASVYWREISLSRRAVPSPLGSRDIFSLMFPMVTLAGMPETVKFYGDVAQEVNRRVEAGKGDLGNEKYRLIWDLFPPWHDMKLWKIFDEAGAVFVVDFYADAFSGRLTSPDAFFSLVEKYLYNPTLQRGIEDKKEAVDRVVEEFRLDGAVFMSNRSCRYFSLGQLDLATYLREKRHLPVLYFEGDHMDPARYHRENVEKQVEVFLEMLSKCK